MAIKLQPRDFIILGGLFESRVMKLEHLCDLYFEGKFPATTRRMRFLKKEGYVRERPRQSHEPSMLFLAKKGLRELKENGFLDKYPEYGLPTLERRLRVSPLTLQHELEVLNVKVA